MNETGLTKYRPPLVLLMTAPLCASVVVLSIVFFHQKLLLYLSNQNILFLIVAGTTLLTAIRAKRKGPLDWVVIACLFLSVTSGFWRSFFYYFYFDQALRLTYNTLCLLFLALFMQRFFSRSLIVFALLFGILLSIQLSCYWIMETFPSAWLLQRTPQGLERDFYSFSYALNNLLHSLTIIIPSIMIISGVYFRKRSVVRIERRTILQFSGMFLISLVGLLRVFFVYEQYTSLWASSLLETISFIPIFYWLIAFRIDEVPSTEENRQIQWAVHLTLFLPLLFFAWSFPDGRSVLIVMTIMVFLEFFLILFQGLFYFRGEVDTLSMQLQDMGDYLMKLWQLDEEAIVITDRDDIVRNTSQSFKRFRRSAIENTRFHEMLSANHNKVASDLSPDMPLDPEKIWLLDSDGTPRPISMHSLDLHGFDEPMTMHVIRDLDRFEQRQTEFQQMYERLFQVRKMESLLRMSGDIGHNFNNFLNGINMYGEMIRMSLDHEDNNAARSYLEGLFVEMERASDYIRKIIASVAPDPLAMTDMDLQQALQDALDLVLRVVNPERYQILLTIPESCARIFGIPQDITEIFFQVIWNAVEAMPEGGTISISAKPSKIQWDGETIVSGEPTAEAIQIEVSDTGTSIPENLKDRIYDPFFSTKNKVGKGIGLTIAYALTKRHRGLITFANNQTHGVTFSILLPKMPELLIDQKFY